MLLERGADMNVQEEDGPTLLHPASFRGHAEVVRVLPVHGAGVSARNALRLTPSLLASGSGNVDVSRILLDTGRTRPARRGDELTVLYLALRWGRARLLACFWSMWVRSDGYGWGRVDSV